MEVQQLMVGLQEAGAAGMSCAFLSVYCDIGVITQEDYR